ncbi:MAG: PfkB domain-containing protein, adenosine kinase [Candidatus Peregrinibacteria bacterium GW2011_GWF2_33_10]|nr:MAG: PfkB domain-containing protein, adenosine kinase [Candidatus Peregrinibacteria bacterium GW2011_GWF2_33_10]OGJ45401.1 MAG: hypothetical protein A2263_03995 [Candidatus Peregrinibacteria bacterium RIFOXYA2_FULL_33_21]OGJ51004.1 MAG: hypothetical protein A2307_05590 [Candidatus Peregrinibacteria bacterium RIFOXYB2_FULL_33_20]
MSLLITGSLAYDHLLAYQGNFSDLIIPEKINNLSICFYTPEKEICFGGCSGNIAYNLNLLKADFVLYGRAGKDFQEYINHFKKHKINTKYIQIDKNDYTATAYVTSDKNGNQITSFAPGVMQKKFKVDISKINKKIDLAIISPEDNNFMQQLINQCIKNNIKFIFDPGQQLPTFKKENILEILKSAFLTIVNDYEMDLLCKITNLDKNYFLKNKKNLIITLGENGSELIENGKIIKIKAYKPKKILNPTGCGDAYRAGLLYGLSQNWNLEKSCDLGSELGSKLIEYRGTQEHVKF